MRCALALASFAWPLICWRANLTWRISWRIRMFSRRICKKSRKPDQGRKRRGDHKIRFQYWKVSIPFISLFLSKISNQVLLPSPLSSLCVLNSDCHQYLTRQKDNLQLTFSLRVQGPQIWNDIPLSLRNSLTPSSYKHKLRDYFQSLSLTMERELSHLICRFFQIQETPQTIFILWPIDYLLIIYLDYIWTIWCVSNSHRTD